MLILHYLQADAAGGGRPATGSPTGRFRERRFYFAAFVKRAVDPLKKAFGQDIAGFGRAAVRLNGVAA